MFRPLFLLSLLYTSTLAFVPAANTPAFARSSSLSSPSSPSSSALNVAIDTSDIKNGLTVEIDGEPFKVVSFSIMKQARGAAKTTIKFKNLMKGNTIENTYRSGEKFQTALIEKKAAQHTYVDENNNYFFMDSETFDEIIVGGNIVDEKAKWISEGMELTLVYFKGNVIEVVVPSSFVYQIVETEPNVKGNTSQGHTKPALLDSGATISVPGYLNQEEMVKVDTDKGVFLERAN
eukprot:CAMPEP_0202465804 /NCGR_PEP_ID=MMETSP1360-20130828/66787_1 /ASSEMBLY_ACC=CAM_ASM_000848 /TAXON_ID=515479 /ORGANISM="Licmophora paradoxa, Strain CCMP2313" /LENGTH=233 /DNA_ID=CAMNT_0049089713 /DNA_START=150 /DNA_END=851 /DNA_ORIENTATION=-